MYWWVPVSIAAIVIAAMFGYAYGRTSDDLPAEEAAAPPTAIASSPEAKGVPRSGDFYLFHCLPDQDDVLTQTQLQLVFVCLKRQGIESGGVSADGTIPVAVFQLFRRAPDADLDGLFIAWRESAEWRTQALTDAGAGSVIGETLTGGAEGLRQQDIDGKTLTAVMTGQYGGSRGPKPWPALLAYEQGKWRVRWVGGTGEMALINKGRVVRFDGDGIRRVSIEGEIFAGSPDGSVGRGVFTESENGPHQYARQVWELRGEEYVLASSALSPSPYSTAVEFVRTLKAGDVAAAAFFTTEQAVIDAALAAGLTEPRDWHPIGVAQWGGMSTSGTLAEGPATCNDQSLDIVMDFVSGDVGPVISSIRTQPRSAPCS